MKLNQFSVRNAIAEQVQKESMRDWCRKQNTTPLPKYQKPPKVKLKEGQVWGLISSILP